MQLNRFVYLSLLFLGCKARLSDLKNINTNSVQAAGWTRFVIPTDLKEQITEVDNVKVKSLSWMEVSDTYRIEDKYWVISLSEQERQETETTSKYGSKDNGKSRTLVYDAVSGAMVYELPQSVYVVSEDGRLYAIVVKITPNDKEPSKSTATFSSYSIASLHEAGDLNTKPIWTKTILTDAFVLDQSRKMGFIYVGKGYVEGLSASGKVSFRFPTSLAQAHLGYYSPRGDFLYLVHEDKSGAYLTKIHKSGQTVSEAVRLISVYSSDFFPRQRMFRYCAHDQDKDQHILCPLLRVGAEKGYFDEKDRLKWPASSTFDSLSYGPFRFQVSDEGPEILGFFGKAVLGFDIPKGQGTLKHMQIEGTKAFFSFDGVAYALDLDRHQQKKLQPDIKQIGVNVNAYHYYLNHPEDFYKALRAQLQFEDEAISLSEEEISRLILELDANRQQVRINAYQSLSKMIFGGKGCNNAKSSMMLTRLKKSLKENQTKPQVNASLKSLVSDLEKASLESQLSYFYFIFLLAEIDSDESWDLVREIQSKQPLHESIRLEAKRVLNAADL